MNIIVGFGIRYSKILSYEYWWVFLDFFWFSLFFATCMCIQRRVFNPFMTEADIIYDNGHRLETVKKLLK